MDLKVIKHLYTYLVLVIATAILFSACSGKSKKPAPTPPNVTTSTIKQQDVPIYIDAVGQVIAPVTVYVRPQVAGKLIKAYYEQGAYVNEGDVLFEIDPRPYQALYDEAIAQLVHDQAILKYALKTVERYKKVLEDDYVAVLTFEQYESNAAAAQAQVDLDTAAVTSAKINLDFTKIIAPVSGKIGYSNVYVGNILALDDPNQITTILPYSPIDITFSLPQQHFELIRRVQGDAGNWKYVASLPEDPTLTFEGTTYFIDNQIDQNTGTILLKGRLPNEKRALWPGEFVRIKVLYKMVPNALVVPPSSVLIGRNGPYVYVVDAENKASARNVIVLTRTEEYTAIESEQVHVGDTVIVDGQINVATGVAVSTVPIKP
jgi:multidrug efflux system membrane fusion protein